MNLECVDICCGLAWGDEAKGKLVNEKGWGCVITRLENAAYPANISVTNEYLNIPNTI